MSARFLGTAQEAKDALRSVQGRVFRNEATGIEAMVTSDTVGKSYAAQMSVRNLMALGYSQEEARQIHYSAFAHVHEIFERADYGEFEKNYAPAQKKGRAGAWHYYGTVDIEGKGSFDVNVTAVVPDRNGGDNRLFSLELTIENPADGRLGYPHTMGPSFNAAGSSEHRLAAYRSNVEKEILKIREEAIKDGTYLKAPNGEDSKLDERLWCVVRTRAFKDYFGDWENEPENASKVVDSNGEPLVVYHGTPEDFGNVFEDKQPESRDYDPNYHRGTFWFTDRRFTAQTYQAKAVFTRHPEPLRRLDTEWEHEDVPAGEHADVLEGLKERTVFRAYDTRNSLHGVRVKLSEAFDEDGMLKEDYYVALELKKGEERLLPSGRRPLSRQLFRASRGSNYFLHEGVKPPRTHKEALEFYARFDGVGDRISVPKRSRLYACFLNIRNPKVYDYEGEKFRDMGYRAMEAQAEGHDGVVVKNVYDPGEYPDAVLPGMSIGVFSPGQIKSVDNRGTFDAGNPNISFSVADARERGLFKDGVMEAENGFIVDGGTDFSAAVDFSHVSPALYRRPDKEHVGTGEGNQVYGWGVLYGAESPMTNRFYHRKFTKKGFSKDGSGEILTEKEVLNDLESVGGFLNRSENDFVLTEFGDFQSWDKVVEFENMFLRNAKRDLADYEEAEKHGGRVGEESMRLAREKVERCEYRTRVVKWLADNYSPTKEIFPVNYRMRADVDDGNVLHWDEPAAKMFEADKWLLYYYRQEGCVFEWNETGGEVYNELVRMLGSARAASEWLDEHGIRGVKYEDGMSRDKEGNKTYNYVIFNPDYVEVIAINNRHAWSEYSEGNPDWQRPEEVFGDGEGSFSMVRIEGQGTDGVVSGFSASMTSAEVARLRAHWRENYDGRPPEGWYVHGRQSKRDLQTGYVVQCTRDNNVARFYAGKGDDESSIWYIRPREGEKLIDMRTEEGREAVREFVRDCVEDYYALTTMARQWASDHGMDMYTDDGEVREEVIDGVVDAFDPVDIEGSAEVYDQPELMGPFWEYVGAPMVVTSHDGAVVLDVENVDAVMVADGAAEDFYVSWEEMDERVWSKQDFSGAMRRAREMELTRRVHELLLGRREEREAKAMVEAWDDWMERFKAVMAGKEGERSRLGRGMEALARMVALLESTRAALPGRYRVGWLDVQLRWATWYAQMMESGEVKMSDVVKDDGLAKKYEERFRKAVERKAELGVDEQGLKEFLADMVGKRMDAILVNVAAKSRRTLERFLKDRARERMDDMARRLYPKRERGKAWPRGKADAATYRFVQEAYKQMDAKPGERGERG